MNTTQSASRRTRADLEASVKYAQFYPGAADAGDVDRIRRLVAHGWLTADRDDPTSPSHVATTGDGNRIAGAVHEAKKNDAFEYGVDVLGVAGFVDVATAVPDPEDAAGFVGKILSLMNLVDEARHSAGNQDVEFDHDGLFAPHLGNYNTRRGTVEVKFEAEDTAATYATMLSPGRARYNYAGVQDPADPTRVVVDVN